MRIKTVDKDGKKVANHKMVVQVLHKKKTTYVNVITGGDGTFLLHDDYRGAKFTSSAAKHGSVVWAQAQEGATLTLDV